ncbi:aldose epimerase family protein [Cellulosilyticum sp. I15G10I2]|uniref:aldose epimerase family protein n=1 Tax=Cellulosilyticum sp. I15G10I2 TaxID=1892843 RepID=UPI00085C210E|nr:aldose epimerase family protein [Cellulosilyticum sp. I15G10I2]
MEIQNAKVTFGSGREVTVYQLINDKGMQVEILSLGGILTKILVPDQEGSFENVLLNWENMETYEENPGYFNALIGRVAGRIYDAKVTINDKVYTFAKNNNGNTLHGGIKGFDKKIWTASVEVTKNEAILKLTYLSKDGEEGFPGNLEVTVAYKLNNENELTIEYKAKTDQDTIVNLTNHAYFNLSGDAKRSVLDQEVSINADKICKLDEVLIPDGELLSVDEHTAFNFKTRKPIGRDIHQDDIQLKYGNGYDHPWLLNDNHQAVEFYDPISKRCMEIFTTEPGVVMYTMNYANEPIKLSNGKIQKPNYGVCFETQKLPIGYNEVFKEDVLLKKGDTYSSATTFKFSVK